MQSRRLIAIITVVAPLTLPTIGLSQGSSGAQLFSSYDNSFPGGSGMAGFGLAIGAGPVAVRGSFGLTFSTFSSTAASATRPPDAGRWSGDADVVLATDLLGLGRLFGGVLNPYGFAGIGAHSASASPTFGDAVKTWSYGGGVTLPISSTISILGEMRQRSTLPSAIASPADFVSGREFRIGLDLRLGDGRRGSAAGSGVRAPSSSGGSWPSGVAAAGAARRVVPRGEKYLGVPYLYGGSTPKAFDCSGFVQYIYRQEGVELPRTSRQMAGSGFAVDPNPRSMAIGDLLLFADNGPISHVAIYAGNGRIIHSSSSGNGVRYDDLSSQRGRWFADHLVKVRRVATGSGAAAVASFAQSLIPFEGFDPPDLAPKVVIRKK